MNLVFVSQEVGKVPSGVITVLTELCRGWPKGDRITILLNPEHWAGYHLRHELKENSDIEVLMMPKVLSSLWAIQLFSSFSRALRLLLRLVCFPVTILQALIMFVWMIVWLRGKRVDGIISHAGGWPAGMLNRWIIFAGFFAKVTHRILVIHNTPVVPQSSLEKRIFRYGNWLMGKMATRIVTVSNACRGSLEHDVDFGRCIDVIYNGIPVGHEALPGQGNDVVVTAWKKQYPSIAFVGEIDPRKGVHVLLDAFLSVSTPSELVLIGNGDDDYLTELETIASHSHFPVHFLGFREDVLNLYQWVDILVLPSLNFESFGMVIVEAMRFGIPVICSDFGGMKEIVADGETGLVVTAGDSCALRTAMERLLRDKLLRRTMGEKGRMRLESMFSSDVMVNNYVTIIHTA